MAGRVIQLTPLYGKTLKERFEECWQQYRPGLEPLELIQYLRETAVILNEIYKTYRFQHLAVNPFQILLQGDRVQLAGLCQAELLWSSSTQPLFLLNPFYSAPEVYRNSPSLQSDQFSLGLIFAALVTGVHPLQKWDRLEGVGEVPQVVEISGLPREDQEVLRRALHEDPDQRFENLPAFLDALLSIYRGRPGSTAPALPSFLMETRRGGPIQAFDHWVEELVRLALKTRGLPRSRDGKGHLSQSLGLFEASENIRHRIDLFCQKFAAKRIAWKENTAVLNLPSLSGSITSGLEVKIALVAVPHDLFNAVVTVRPLGKGDSTQMELEAQAIFEQVRQVLQNRNDQRRHSRILWNHPLVLNPVLNFAKFAKPLQGVIQDISQGGIGLCLPCDMPVSHFYFNLPESGALAGYSGLARVVRKKPLSSGWYEIGASFVYK